MIPVFLRQWPSREAPTAAPGSDSNTIAASRRTVASETNATLAHEAANNEGAEIVDMQSIYPSGQIDVSVKMRRLLSADRIVLVRLSIYCGDDHVGTVALTDDGNSSSFRPSGTLDRHC